MVSFGVDVGKFLENPPYLIPLVIVLFIVGFIIEVILKLKDVFKRESRLYKLIEFHKIAEEKDKTLIDFINLQIKDELFKESTGYVRNDRYKLIVDFYTNNCNQFNWHDIRLIISRFETNTPELKLKKRGFLTRFGDMLYYVYYGLLGMLLPVILIFKLILKNQNSFLLIILFILFGLSFWLILKKREFIKVYERALKILK